MSEFNMCRNAIIQVSMCLNLTCVGMILYKSVSVSEFKGW